MAAKIIALRVVVVGACLGVLLALSGPSSVLTAHATSARTASSAVPAQASAQSTKDLPELVYMCPMPQDADVVLDKPGKCPKCGMDLKPIRIVAAYSCLKNTAFIRETPGKCPTDRTDMVPVSVSLFFGCSGNNDVHELFPGKCPDGSDRVKKYEPRPHGDHNPRHGGLLFMADDAWHHLEGAYPSAGLFRVYFYDDWTKPMAPAGFTARTVVQDKMGKEIGTYALKSSPISNALEIQVPSSGLPFMASVFVTFKPGDKEKKFDFQFSDYTKEPTAAPAAPSAPASAPKRGAAITPRPGRIRLVSYELPAQDPQQNSGVQMSTQVELMPPVTLQEDPIPPGAKEVLKELTARTQEVESLIRDGALPMVWVPAIRSKNLALALLDNHIKEIPEKQRPLATSAVNRLVRAAWQIDTLGDLGDKDKILTVHAAFTEAAHDLTSAYASIR